MRRRDLLRRTMALPVVSWARAGFSLADGSKPNASDVYRKVFGWGVGFPMEDYEILRDPDAANLDDKRTVALIDKAREPIRALREAAKIADCRWSPESSNLDRYFEEHLHYANGNVVGAACLSARRHAKAGRGGEALDDLFAGLIFARRIGTGGAMIARILEAGFEIRTLKTIGRILPDLDRAALDDLERRLVAFPKPDLLSATLAGPERRYIVLSVRESLKKAGATIEGKEWEEIGFDAPTAETLRKLTGGDRDKLVAHLDAMTPAFAELGRLLDLPREEGSKALERFAKENAAAFPIVTGVVEIAASARNPRDRTKAFRTMCLAAIALIRDGETAFRRVSDPFGNGPFGLERSGKGYILRSSLKIEGLESALRVGDSDRA